MKVQSQVFNRRLPAMGCSLVAAALLLASSAFAQQTATIEELEAQLEQQRLALQEAIADREATFFRSQDVEAQLSESEETKRQIEQELKMLCEEQETLKPGSFEACMSTSNN